MRCSPGDSSLQASSTWHAHFDAPSETVTAPDQSCESNDLSAIPNGDSAPRRDSPPADVPGTAAAASVSSLTTEVVPTPEPENEEAVTPSDLWSKAYQEAVQSMGQDVDITILKGENIAELFKELEKVDSDATGESTFLRGVRYLSSIKVPLERFKLALDITAPLTALEPTTSTVFGVIRGVTVVSIAKLTWCIMLQVKTDQIIYS